MARFLLRTHVYIADLQLTPIKGGCRRRVRTAVALTDHLPKQFQKIWQQQP
uniref:Uncharacterized protein n=1 Tax=Meloidogyne enterolobii TaxID=390850 RepID=A0A6V7X7X0_MELEN|nr:unnamed protein product [Meloidogyne enterolobii]